MQGRRVHGESKGWRRGAKAELLMGVRGQSPRNWVWGGPPEVINIIPIM